MEKKLMEKKLMDLLESAKKNKEAIRLLKEAALVCQKYELAAILRILERHISQ